MNPIASTYRLQLRGPQADPSGRAFGFAEAEGILDYLQALGVSHVYLSPILTSTSGSAHSYDVVDPTTINEELGGIEGFRSFAQAVHKRNMGIIIDIVPNHVGVADPTQNAWWWDVLRFGQDSTHAHYFDIDFHADNGADGKLGLPILGAEGDETQLTFTTVTPRGGEPQDALAYYDHIFPIAPGTKTDDPLTTYQQQHYKLLYWKNGIINYRRFFSVNELAGLRQEDPEVFANSHAIIKQLCEENLIDGVRVDHPDGLSTPFSYLNQLRELIGPKRWLLVEKILEVTEPLDPRLKVDGTTGYDALRELDGVFVHRQAEDTFSMLAAKQTGSAWDDTAISATAHMLKAQVAQQELAAEVQRLARAVRRDNFSTAGSNVTDEQLKAAIIDLVAEMPVYRADYLSLSRVTANVVANLAQRFPSRRAALDLIVAAMVVGGEAATRFAQVCGAVMAKGVEDTTFYRAARLVALQEVGGAPGHFGVSAAEFHLLQHERAQLWPRTMTTLSTHDTKRSEDVRARILALSWDAPAFAELVHKVHALAPAPDQATGHFLLQNFIGFWPADGVITEDAITRANAYAIKAVREAGVHTEWTAPNASFEQAIQDWTQFIFQGPVTGLISEFVAELHPDAVTISLGRKLLQLLSPGIPDVYQGTELWDDSLVDPDNRRFVDYTKRQQMLENLAQHDWSAPFDPMRDADLAKLHITHTALSVRGTLDPTSVYHPVFAQGPEEGSCIGFARGGAGRGGAGSINTIAFAARFKARNGWQDTTLTLPSGTWHDSLTGRSFHGTVAIADLFASLPCVLLVAAETER